MKTIHKTIILALAAICLLAVPALSSHWNNNHGCRGAAGVCQGGWLLLADDITAKDLNNMTFAEIKELRQQKMQELQNMTPAEIQNLMDQKRQEIENMTFAEIRDMRRDLALKSRYLVGDGFAGLHGGTWMLLVDDATRDNFQNMTRAEMDKLRQQKLQELQNMTPAEIQDLRELKVQELRNTTISELKVQRPQMLGWGGPFVGLRHHGRYMA
jgi:DNA-binding transcriptional regulator YiaG